MSAALAAMQHAGAMLQDVPPVRFLVLFAGMSERGGAPQVGRTTCGAHHLWGAPHAGGTAFRATPSTPVGHVCS
jgi:hypothetical protein